MKKVDVVCRLLEGRPCAPRKQAGTAFAPANIALCKYWGKRDEELNLPVTPSLSVSLGALGTHTTVALQAGGDTVILNDRPLPETSSFAVAASAYLDLFRAGREMFFKVTTRNTVPTAAGVASSASGFAAFALALDDLFGWNLARKDLSILARLGSGSACRSVCDGFVEWHAGTAADGMDSFAEPLAERWPELRLGLISVSSEPKSVSSRAAMRRTRETSALYEAWPGKVAQDLVQLKQAIRDRDFERLGRVAESNALAMHATALAAWPPVLFWLPASVAAMHKIWQRRAEGMGIYLTMDAGPNVKLLFLARDEAGVVAAFPGIEVAKPFQ